MVDITNKPFFKYNKAIDQLMRPIQSQTDVRFVSFSRRLADQSRFLLCHDKNWGIDFFTVSKLYQHGVYEKNLRDLQSTFQMHDHMAYSPPEVYIHMKKKHNMAHGLTIIQQFGDYCDFLIFATDPQNNQINNFYLNQKELFVNFVNDFYKKMAKPLVELETHKFSVPSISAPNQNPIPTLSPRQKACALLLTGGSSTKEIAQKLLLSPRTVEYHIDALREKFHSRNRADLVYSLSKLI